MDISVEPPVFAEPEADDEQERSLHVAVWITETDGTQRNVSLYLPGEPSDPQLAEALICALRGVAASRGPALVAAIERRLP